MRARKLDGIKTKLLAERRRILDSALHAQNELEALRGAERDPEFEEGAQSELEQYTLSLLGEAQARRVSMIDAAIARINEGSYGTCLDCGNEIEQRRLEVLPFALLCTECATRRERGTAAEAPYSSL